MEPVPEVDLAGYKQLDRLGRGGYATVYRAYDARRPKRFFALKRFTNPDHVNTFMHEVRMMQAIDGCPGTVRLQDFGRHREQLELVGDYIEGIRLDHYIQRHGALPEDEVFKALDQLLSTLQCIHQRGVLHKDIKPSNIIRRDGQYYLLDWGVADRAANPRNESIRANQNFVAPECYYGEQGPATDFYSLGWLVYFMLTGRLPYHFAENPDPSYRIWAHCRERPSPVASLTERQRLLVLGLIHKDPRDRLVGYDREGLLQAAARRIDWSAEYPEYPTPVEHFLQLASQAGIPYAQHLQAEEQQLSGDHAAAFGLFNAAAAQGYAKSMYRLSRLYQKGRGCAQDSGRYQQWLVAAAEAGHAAAQNHLGYMLMHGQPPWPRDLVTARHWLMQAAEQGHARAQNNLGLLYERKLAQPEEALGCFLLAAERGHASARNNLARCYLEGIGTAPDAARARYWYGRSADSGNVKARAILQKL